MGNSVPIPSGNWIAVSGVWRKPNVYCAVAFGFCKCMEGKPCGFCHAATGYSSGGGYDCALHSTWCAASQRMVTGCRVGDGCGVGDFWYLPESSWICIKNEDRKHEWERGKFNF